MINEELRGFVERSIQEGKSYEKITKDLLANGWNQNDINEVFASINYIQSRSFEDVTDKTNNFKSILFSILVLLLLSGIGYWWFEYRGNNSLSLTKETTQIPENFLRYNSEAGFSLDYPNDWKVEGIKAVEFDFGGASFTTNTGDILTIHAGLDDPQGFEFFKKEKEEHLIKYPPKNTTVLSKRDIKIGQKEAYEIILQKDENKILEIYLLAGSLNGIFDIMVLVRYEASLGSFDQEYIKKVLDTFQENILANYVKKSEEAAKERSTPRYQADSRIDNAIGNLNSGTAVVVYDRYKSYETLCINGFINPTNELVKWYPETIIDALGVSSQSEAGIKCFANKEKYAISARLYDGSPICIDSQESNYLKTLPATADKTTLTCK